MLLFILEALARSTGVELAFVVSPDGSLLAATGRALGRTRRSAGALGTEDALAAEAAYCLRSLSDLLASFQQQGLERVFVQGSRGSLVLRPLRASILGVLTSSSPVSLGAALEAAALRLDQAQGRERRRDTVRAA